MSLGRYLTSSAFMVDVMENWQSEYLQFTLFILATVWLVQRGSTESKPLGREGTESDEEQKVGRARRGPTHRGGRRRHGWRLALYSNSLVLAHGDDLDRVVVRPARDRARRLQRRAVRPPRGAR